MKVPILFRTGIYALLAASLIGSISIPAFAGGSGEGAPAKRPRPDTEKKVITNDDLEAKYGKPTPASEMQNSQAIAASTQTTPATQSTANTARREPLPPEQDPVWYAQQAVSLNNELAEIDSEAQRLLQFRQTGTGVATGLILDVPCEGITTDNRISQLLERRSEIEALFADLQDTARRNDIPPGIFDQASEILQASEQQPALTPAEQRAALAERLQSLSGELAETQSVVEGMEEATAAQHMSLLPPNGYGGNMTTDLLERLASRTNALENQIDSAEDKAFRIGIPARDLP